MFENLMRYQLIISKEARRALEKLKKKDVTLFSRVEQIIEKILENPELGKPLRYTFKNNRRIRVGSFVLLYEILRDVVRLVDFNHHDKIYKKR